MPRNSFAKIKRELAFSESAEVTEQLSLEKIELAELLEQETGLDFDQALSIIDLRCNEVLVGYRGADRLFIFRSQIRDRFTDAIRRDQEISNHQYQIEHEDSCTCPPAVRYGVDIPGLGCEVCPYCAEKLDEEEIPF